MLLTPGHYPYPPEWEISDLYSDFNEPKIPERPAHSPLKFIKISALIWWLKSLVPFVKKNTTHFPFFFFLTADWPRLLLWGLVLLRPSRLFLCLLEYPINWKLRKAPISVKWNLFWQGYLTRLNFTLHRIEGVMLTNLMMQTTNLLQSLWLVCHLGLIL